MSKAHLWCSGNLDTDETRLRPPTDLAEEGLAVSLPDDDH